MEGCGERISWAIAAALLAAPEAMLHVEIEGCGDATYVRPRRLTLARSLAAVKPSYMLSHLVSSAARAWALGDIQGLPGPLELKLAAMEAWSYAVARRAGVRPDMGIIGRTLLLLILLGNNPHNPAEAFNLLDRLRHEATPRGAAVKLLMWLLGRTERRIAAVQEGEAEAKGYVGDSSRKRVNAARIHRALTQAAARRSLSRGWQRPPKRLALLGDDVILPGGSWGPVGKHVVLLDVSASMEGKLGIAVEAAAHALSYPARTRVLALFDTDVRKEIVNPPPGALKHGEDLAPAGGTGLSKPLSRYTPCKADLVTVISDWGVVEDDLRESMALMRKHTACGGGLVLVGVSPHTKAPRGRWIALDLAIRG
ncbi:hypothetical protein [Aeropyrum camini]|uniref:VWA domain-containing protein n=1 Tax=Aeropyrum camini SY1 = JCM 12091 TaxID=1198449 RepID=U3T957_9CREN|nr:hypothetical protein [Aeropyrum camini]BAN90057.1 hypothetical protein ACAM_0588 [Aeropyrum camini SY1 = JCM 12091]